MYRCVRCALKIVLIVYLLQSNVMQISTALFQRLKPCLDRYAELDYNMNELQYSECDVNDPFALALGAALTSAVV